MSHKPTHSSRRDFLKTGLFAGAAVSMFSLPALADEAETPADAPVLPQNLPAGKRNVILMIADGAGFSSFDITSDYMTGSPRGLIYNGPCWTMLGCSTYSINGSYDPALMWNDFQTHKKDATDSAAASTTLHTGVKTKDGRIARDKDKKDLLTIAELAHQNGFATAAITSVGCSHATPGGVVGHVSERGEGHKLFRRMIERGNLDVLIGGGHPEFDQNGKRREAGLKFSTYGPDEAMWKTIKEGGLPEGFAFIDSREAFQRLANGENVPAKLLGLAPVAETFQQQRDKGMPLLETSPTLTEAAIAGLNVVNRNEKGFFTMIEGGAVDWCNHGNNLARSVEEMQEFNEAVAAVCAWIEKNSSWDETLLIVTADHDCGAIWGPDADKPESLFQRPILKGKGNLPDAKYFSGSHSNQLVPFYFRGRNAAGFFRQVRGMDERAAEIFQFNGIFVDNGDIFPVAKEAFGL